jgi:hypothetical protein
LNFLLVSVSISSITIVCPKYSKLSLGFQYSSTLLPHLALLSYSSPPGLDHTRLEAGGLVENLGVAVHDFLVELPPLRRLRTLIAGSFRKWMKRACDFQTELPYLHYSWLQVGGSAEKWTTAAHGYLAEEVPAVAVHHVYHFVVITLRRQRGMVLKLKSTLP